MKVHLKNLTVNSPLCDLKMGPSTPAVILKEGPSVYAHTHTNICVCTRTPPLEDLFSFGHFWKIACEIHFWISFGQTFEVLALYMQIMSAKYEPGWKLWWQWIFRIGQIRFVHILDLVDAFQLDSFCTEICSYSYIKFEWLDGIGKWVHMQSLRFVIP